MGKLFAGLGAGSGMAAAAAVVLVLVGVAGWVQYDRSTATDPATAVAVKPEVKEPAPTAPQTAEAPEPTTEAPQETAEAPAAKPEAPTDTDLAEATESAPEQEVAEAAPLPPAFDEVRREQDGAMIIAGRALPGAEVRILQDGMQIATTTADGNGKFAAFASVPPDGKGHVLTLLQVTAEGSLPSDDQIVLAPLAAPVVAEVEAEDPQPETAQVAEQATPAEAPVVTDAEPKEEVQVAVADTSEEPQPKPETEAEQSPAKVEENIVAALTPEAQAPVSENAPAKPEETVLAETETAQSTSQTAETAAPTDDPAPSVTTAEVAAPAKETAGTPATSDDTTLADAPQPEPTAVAPVTESAEAAETQPEPEAPARVAVLKTTEDGVELLNPDAPEVMDNVAIDTISYSDTGAVELAGRAQQQAQSVRIYLDNTSVASLPVDEAGNWRGSLPQVDEGIYKLRVDEVAADGTVTSRVETPFKRESPAVLAAASAEREGPIKAITVQKGATLWAIARDRYGKGELYVRVFEANRSAIRDPDLIYPGQIFDLPD